MPRQRQQISAPRRPEMRRTEINEKKKKKKDATDPSSFPPSRRLSR